MRQSRPSSNASTSSSEEPENQQLFVKLPSGETLSLLIPTDTSLPTLLHLLSLRTSAPLPSLRLLHAGKHLTSPTASSPSNPLHQTSSSPTLQTLAIPPNATLHLTLPILGGMPPPKKQRCTFKDCKDAAQRIVGDCSFCEGHYCGKHRMLEDHVCSGLEDCKAEGRERNKNTLEGERTNVIRGV